MPLWGLALMGTCVLYLTPLVYIKNKEAIDNLLAQGSEIASSQANQLRDMTAHHTGKATSQMKGLAGEYSSKAQSYMGRRSSGPTASHQMASDLPSAPKQGPALSSSANAAPSAPTHEPSVTKQELLLNH